MRIERNADPDAGTTYPVPPFVMCLISSLDLRLGVAMPLLAGGGR